MNSLSNGDGTIGAWLARGKFGRHSLHNSEGNPCKTYHASKGLTKLANSSEAWIAKNANKYPAIKPQIMADFAAGRLTNRPCFVTNIVMVLVPNTDWKLSIHNLDNSDKSHKNFDYGIAELNVSQDGVIPCLISAFIGAVNGTIEHAVRQLSTNNDDDNDDEPPARIQHLLKMWETSPGENPKITQKSGTGNQKLYHEQKRAWHLPTIIGNMVASHVQSDVVKSKRTSKKVVLKVFGSKKAFRAAAKAKSFELLVNTGAIGNCSNSYLTIENLWSRFSFERKSHKPSIPHFKLDVNKPGEIDMSEMTTCARSLNSASGWTRDKFLVAVLTQIRVELTPAVHNYLEGEQMMRKVVDELDEKTPEYTITDRGHNDILPPTFKTYDLRLQHYVIIKNKTDDKRCMVVMRGPGAVPNKLLKILVDSGVYLLWYKNIDAVDKVDYGATVRDALVRLASNGNGISYVYK
jgi:hypothetical protein